MQKIIYGNDVRNYLKLGIDYLTNAVKVTFGPKGRTVIISTNGERKITKDGVSVARSISHPNPLINIGVQLVKEASVQTATEVGDGTTTSTILAQAIFNNSLKKLTKNTNLNLFKAGMNLGVDSVIAYLKQWSREPKQEDFRNIASISSNNDSEITNLLAQTLQTVHTPDAIFMDESITGKSYIEFVQGLQIDNGFIIEQFSNSTGNIPECKFKNAKVLISDYVINSIQPLIPILEKAIIDDTPLVLLVDSIDTNTINTLLANARQSNLKICCIANPYYGNFKTRTLKDIAILTNGTYVSEKEGISITELSYDHLGTVTDIKITKDSTLFVNNSVNKEAINKRIKELTVAIQETIDSNLKEKYINRKAQLSNGIGTIYVGGKTPSEQKEKWDRVEDAVLAMKAAKKGISLGAGVSFLKAKENFKTVTHKDKDTEKGYIALMESLDSPFLQLCINANLTSTEMLKMLDAQMDIKNTKKCFIVPSNCKLIDPTEVLISALTNSVSISNTLLSTECLIIEE